MTAQDLQEAAELAATVNNPETAYTVHAELILDGDLCVKRLQFSTPGLSTELLRLTFRTWYEQTLGYSVGPDIRIL